MLVLLILAAPLRGQTDTVIISNYPLVTPFFEVTATIADWDGTADTLGIHNFNPTGTPNEEDALKEAYANAFANLLIAPFKELQNENPVLSSEPVIYIRTTLAPTDIDSMRLAFLYDQFPNTVSSANVISSLSLFHLDLAQDPARWILVESEIDTVQHTVSALIDEPGYYAVFARAEPPDALLYNITSYPNPFGWGDRTSCTISYALSSHSDVTVNIFAPGGGRVYSKTFVAGTPGGIGSSDGLYLNQVVWDGRNENGRRVDSGGYLCIISTPDGTSGSWKIGVVR